MGYRLSQISTRTGDDGSTGLADNSRLPKNHPRIVALGEVDELNACLGLLLCEALPADVKEVLQAVQQNLFQIGGELAWPGHPLLAPDAVVGLEAALEKYKEALPPLKEFILPGGCRAAALAHMARTVARRAERSVVALLPALQTQEEADRDKDTPSQAHNPKSLFTPLVYLNRLSDLLFVLARVFNAAEGAKDVYWQSQKLGTNSH